MVDESEYLIGGDELFHHTRFTKHFEFMLENYKPNNKPVAFFMSCSKHKPFYKSPYRRVFNAMIEKKLNIRKISQIYTVSEPAILIPEELDDTNITRYDFPPAAMQTEGRRIFIERLAAVLPKHLLAHEKIFYILPKHHRGIFEASLKIIAEDTTTNTIDKTLIASRIKYAPPLTYNLPKAKAIIVQTLDLQIE